MTFRNALTNWTTEHTTGRRPATVQFNQEIQSTILAHWVDKEQPPALVSRLDVLNFGGRVTHFCPSRWNAIVSALRAITPHGKSLKRRPLGLRPFTPPPPELWQKFLAQCDRDPRTPCGPVVRLFSHTGFRFTEGYALTWANVKPDHFHLEPETSKGNRARSVPFLPGVPAILDTLRPLGDGTHVLPRANVKCAMHTASRRAGITPMSYHSLRHYFATKCIESGVDIPTVARWLGHRDGGALCARTYFHLLDSHSRRMAQQVVIG